MDLIFVSESAGIGQDKQKGVTLVKTATAFWRGLYDFRNRQLLRGLAAINGLKLRLKEEIFGHTE